MHRRLRRLLELHLGADRAAQPELRALCRDLDAEFERAEQDRGSLKRALDLLSDLSRRPSEPPVPVEPGRSRVSRLVRRFFLEAPVATVICDPQLQVLAWNQSAERIFGFSAAEATGRQLPALLFTDGDRAVAGRELAGVLERGELEQSLRVCSTRSGDARLDEWTVLPFRRNGRVEGAAVLVRDPFTAPDRHALAVKAIGDAVFDWDVVAGRLWLSDAWATLVGESPLKDAPADWLDRVHPSDREQLDAAIKAHFEGDTDHFESEHRLRHQLSGWRWVLARGTAVRDATSGAVTRMHGSFMDVTRRREESESALHDALHDPLTRLPNRALFLDLVRRSFARTRRKEGYVFAVVFLDLDRFKAVNDGLGHAAGDDLLSQMARRLQSCLREGDTLARHGGDEFTILLDDVNGPADAQIVADRIHQVTAQPFDLSGHEVFSTLSVGVALFTPGYARPEDMLLDADTAMYRAKALGRARTVVFDPSMRERAPQLLDLEADLRRALLRNEFRVHYLPLVEVASGRIQGLEALIRWAHPKRGLMGPEQFIPFAEETGLIVPIGKWLLHEAGREFGACRSASVAQDLTLHVNLSSKQLLNADLLDQLDEVMYEHQIAPRELALELTESALQQTEHSETRVAELRDRGVQLCMDDFGTGYSSISSLHRFAFDSLKIDRSLFTGGSPRGKAPELVRSIVSLAREMGTPVVAEGVETAEQFRFLRELGCAGAQGYYFSPPVDAHMACSLVASGATW